MRVPILLGAIGSVAGLSITNPIGIDLLLYAILGYIPLRDFPDTTPATIKNLLEFGYWGSLSSASAGLLATYFSRTHSRIGGAALLATGAFGLYSELTLVPALNYDINCVVVCMINAAGVMTYSQYALFLLIACSWTAILIASGILGLITSLFRKRSQFPGRGPNCGGFFAEGEPEV